MEMNQLKNNNKNMVIHEVPDGGWGWLVVIGVAVTNMFNQALVSLFGLIFGEKLENMGHGTSGVALVINIMSCVTNFSGFITGPALKNFSYRKVAVIGCLLTSSGLILSSLATSMWQIILFFSLLSGLGLGLITPSCFVAVNSYFSKRRGRAVGFAMAGTGLGQMLMPHVVRYLLDEYGYHGTTLIFGALALHGVVGASLFQPVEWHMKTRIQKDETDVLLIKDTKSNALQIKPVQKYSNDIKNNIISTSTIKEKEEHKLLISNEKNSLQNNVINPPSKLTKWQRFSVMLDLNLLMDWVFLNITFGLSVAYTSSIYFSMLFPFFLQEGKPKLNRSQTATCMSALAGADIIARLTLPSITHKMGMNARLTFFFGTISLAAARSILALQDKYYYLIIVSLITGYIRAGTVVNQNLTISENCSQKQLPSALGLNMVNKGLFALTLGQLLGWIRDYTASFQMGIHAANCLLIIVFIFWLPEILFKKFKRKKLNQEQLN